MDQPPLTEPTVPSRVQVNVRLPRALRDEIDARRALLGISRDVWVERALTWAMNQPPRNRSSATVTALGKRTVRVP